MILIFLEHNFSGMFSDIAYALTGSIHIELQFPPSQFYESVMPEFWRLPVDREVQIHGAQ